MILPDEDKEEILKCLRTIEGYCTTQGWTADRRWLIEQLARKVRLTLEKPLVRPIPRD